VDGTFAQCLEAALGALCPSCGGPADDARKNPSSLANAQAVELGGTGKFELSSRSRPVVCQSCQQRWPPGGGGLHNASGIQVCRSGFYQGSLRQMILRAKASPHSPAWHGLAQRLLRQVQASGICPQWITVPPPSWRRRWQGWHLAAELAQRLSRDLGSQYLPLLRRRQRRPAQAGLGAHARRQNLEGAFGLAPGFRNRLPPSLWIVDDVWTTGATFLECQRVLEHEGVYVHGALLLAQVENLEVDGVDEGLSRK